MARRLRGIGLAAAALAAGALLAPGARADRLPIQTFTTADGLPSDGIRKILRDSRGFVWLVHAGHLTRSDGAHVEVYGREAGLPAQGVRDLIETRGGRHLVATTNGLYRLDAHGPRTFVPVPVEGIEPGALRRLAEDREGRIWAAGLRALLALSLDPGGESARVVARRAELAGAGELLAAADGSVWAGTAQGLVRIASDGSLERVGGDDVRSLAEGRDGAVWVGTTTGLARVRPGGSLEPVLPGSELPDRFVRAVLPSRDGSLWIGAGGLGHRVGGAVRWVTTADGLPQNEITALWEDPWGDLWFGTESGGAGRLARSGVVAYTEAEGLEDPRIGGFLETRDGTLVAHAGSILHVWTGTGFRAVRPALPAGSRGWGWSQWTLQDRAGDWWIPTRVGLFRFSGIRRVEDLETARPSAVYAAEPFGTAQPSVFRLFEDAAGDVWVGLIGRDVRAPLARWERRTGTWRLFGVADGYPRQAPTAFREDGRGGLWIGLYDGGVVRLRGARFRRFGRAEGCPEGLVRALHLDRAGRLWIATEGGGLARVDDPAADAPAFTAIDAARGLSSDLAACLAEDGQGRIWIGNDRGLDRLDPATGAVVRLTTAEGLPNGFVNAAWSARDGTLWFGTLRGVARLDPRAETVRPPPRMFLESIRIAGEPFPLSMLGQGAVEGLRLSARNARLSVTFGAIDPACSSSVRFQHRLVGVDRDWCEPGPAHTVEYGGVAPGTYALEVRALDGEGRVSPEPARVSFAVLPPLWRRPWAVALLAAAAAAAAVAVHRSRVHRAVALERIRTRIATDLHDDIGSSLSRIAILAEVLKDRSAREDASSREDLASIAETSRGAVDAMGDIVWAINPRRDRMADLVHRMRRFAVDALGPREIALSFHAPQDGAELRLGPDVRRQVYLVLKESVTNAVRHSGCTRVGVSFRREGHRLVLEVRDDGQGFRPADAADGNGLASMVRRAEAMRGTLALRSSPGSGTTVRLEVPLPHVPTWAGRVRRAWDRLRSRP